MKKIYLLILFIIPFILIAQEDEEIKSKVDSILILCKTIDPFYLSKDPNNYSTKYDSEEIPEQWILPVTSLVKNNSGEYLKVYYKLDSGYVNKNKVYIPENHWDRLFKKPNEYTERNELAKDVGYMIYKEYIDNMEKEYEGYKKKGLVITDYEYAYEEYSDRFGLGLTFYNGYTKPIKYINITFRSYNRVCDQISDDFGRIRTTARVIGPLEEDEKASVTFDDLYWDSRGLVEYIKVTYMKVTFMDGTIRELKNIPNQLGKNVSFGCSK